MSHEIDTRIMTVGKAKIDNTLCVGCGVCQQLCKFDALETGKEA